jgi:hypothetical protein
MDACSTKQLGQGNQLSLVLGPDPDAGGSSEVMFVSWVDAKRMIGRRCRVLTTGEVPSGIDFESTS